ncbi:hypothetical protein TRICHSKD4_1033 [Roseibium sp. TrichSKD4]|uniref:hypothetical protein n=1 Tax=Roseibium sp. TrichSKD4 TaxID=744980 RepID=UPI0001E56390|nr:hypothetical protein [Roseibium sp. TrichSKD4]EFO33914.1 hypothetical protein TRICHSKD4_1033 [Roseibium sp. TrichSKD4]
MTREEIEQTIADLEAAKRQQLLGRQRVEITGSQGGGVKYQLASLSEINQEIALLKIELAKLTGRSSGVGPVLARFGGQQ